MTDYAIKVKNKAVSNNISSASWLKKILDVIKHRQKERHYQLIAINKFTWSENIQKLKWFFKYERKNLTNKSFIEVAIFYPWIKFLPGSNVEDELNRKKWSRFILVPLILKKSGFCWQHLQRETLTFFVLFTWYCTLGVRSNKVLRQCFSTFFSFAAWLRRTTFWNMSKISSYIFRVA